MDILGLTNFDQVRGVLTVSAADLPDQVLTNYGLEDDLAVDLASWASNWETLASSNDEAQKLLAIYAKYRCASWLAASGQNFILTQFTDGANAGQRSDTEGFQELRRHLEGRASKYKSRIEQLVDNNRQSTFRPAMGIANPSRNPVLEGR